MIASDDTALRNARDTLRIIETGSGCVPATSRDAAMLLRTIGILGVVVRRVTGVPLTGRVTDVIRGLRGAT